MRCPGSSASTTAAPNSRAASSIPRDRARCEPASTPTRISATSANTRSSTSSIRSSTGWSTATTRSSTRFELMSDEAHTLQRIARHLIVAARPLIEAGASLGAFSQLMGRVGFFATDIPAPYQELATRVSDAADAIETFPSSPSLQDVLGLLDEAKGIYDAVQDLESGPVPTGADAAGYSAEIGERLFELLLVDYLAAEQPGARNVLA